MFILGTTEMESRRLLDAEKLEERFNKIDLLVNISEGIRNFLELQTLLSNVGAGVKDHISKALIKFNSKCAV